MRIVVKNPSKAYLHGNKEELDRITSELTYKNTSAQHLVKRHYNNRIWRSKNAETWKARLEELKANVTKTLVFEDDIGYYIRPGSIPYLDFLNIELINEISYPATKKIPWSKPLPFELHEYQSLSSEKLIEIKHGNVELCTSAGKSAILLKVCRETGLNTVIVAPSKSIFYELIEKFEHHLGKGNVGKFGDQKRVFKKFTIAIGDSIANIKPKTKEWEFFSQLEMLCVDESHTWGAETLEEICHGVLSNIPYRLFFSGTQTRGDGTEKLLQSIIGKTVHRLTTKEAKEKGFICDHEFNIVEIESSNPNFSSKDDLEMKRVHFLENRNIAAFTAKLINAEATLHGRQTLVLVQELSQISMLIKQLKVPFAYAHSESKPQRLTELGLEKVDPKESVEKFNKNEVFAIIGTSCISTGTNIYPVHNCINWVGGTSEIKTKQGAVGRAVRKGNQNPYKDKCKEKTKSKIWDFAVKDVELMIRQLAKRIPFYKDSGSPIKVIKLK